MNLKSVAAMLLILKLMAMLLPVHCNGDDALLRFRLMRVREEALLRQNEKVLMPLLSASKKLSENWNSISDQEKTIYASKSETALGIASPAALPNGMQADQIPFAVLRREWLDVQFAQIDGVDKTHLSYDVYAPPKSQHSSSSGNLRLISNLHERLIRLIRACLKAMTSSTLMKSRTCGRTIFGNAPVTCC